MVQDNTNTVEPWTQPHRLNVSAWIKIALTIFFTYVFNFRHSATVSIAMPTIRA